MADQGIEKVYQALGDPPLLIRLPASIKTGWPEAERSQTPVMAFWAMMISGISE